MGKGTVKYPPTVLLFEGRAYLLTEACESFTGLTCDLCDLRNACLPTLKYCCLCKPKGYSTRWYFESTWRIRDATARDLLNRIKRHERNSNKP